MGWTLLCSRVEDGARGRLERKSGGGGGSGETFADIGGSRERTGGSRKGGEQRFRLEKEKGTGFLVGRFSSSFFGKKSVFLFRVGPSPLPRVGVGFGSDSKFLAFSSRFLAREFHLTCDPFFFRGDQAFLSLPVPPPPLIHAPPPF